MLGLGLRSGLGLRLRIGLKVRVTVDKVRVKVPSLTSNPNRECDVCTPLYM